MERSENSYKIVRFTVRKLELKKNYGFFFHSLHANGFVYVNLVSMRRILLAKIATPCHPRVTVNYSNLPHSQDYLAPGIEHGTPQPHSLHA